MIDTRDSSLFGTRNPMEGEVRIPSGAPSRAFFHKKGGKIGGDTIIRAMEPMARPLQRVGRRLCGVWHLS